MHLNLLSDNPLFGSYPTGIYVFGVEIQYYAIVIVCGMLIAASLSALLMKRRNMDPNFVFTLFVFCIPSAIIGARLFSCLTDPGLGLQSFFKFPWSGLSITGGVIGGVTAGLIVCLVCKVNFLRAADCVVINILIAQALGRWGNFFNGEVYGRVVTSPSMQWFPFAVPIISGMGGVEAFSHLESATWHYAFFFYESVLDLLGWAILFTLAWKFAKKPNGVFLCSYFVWYGTVRSIMEPLRDPQFILSGGGIWWSEVFAILMVVLGLAGIAALVAINYKKEGALFGSKEGEPLGIAAFLSSDKKTKPYFSEINMLGANYPQKPVKGEGGGAEEEVTPPEGSETPEEAAAPESETPSEELAVDAPAETPEEPESVTPEEAMEPEDDLPSEETESSSEAPMSETPNQEDPHA